MNGGFAAYITEQRVAAQLCKEVGKYIFRPSGRAMPAHVSGLYQLLPPRRLWANLSPEQRHDSPSERSALRRLQGIVLRHLRHRSSYTYLARLTAFAASLQAIAQHPDSYSFPLPTVKAKIKKQTPAAVVCRPICAYHDLTAKILTALMADYLKSWLDPMLHYTNMAYRAPREWEGQPSVVTSNVQAVDLLLRWRAAHDSRSIYIAECDICKFFDTIDHDDVIDALQLMMQRCGLHDPSFFELFTRFIHSFDFRRDVMACNSRADYWRSQFGDEADNHSYRFDWIEQPPAQPVGIPQGVALSPLIANMLLNIIDEQTLGDRLSCGRVTDQRLLYVRYCDDILIAHEDADACASILHAYCHTLDQHHLRYHPLQSVAGMKNGLSLKRDAGRHYLFWDAKSKLPYLWGEGAGNAAQWIGFLGYEVSRDGQIRLRKSSVANQAEKIVKRAMRIRSGEQHLQADMIQRFARQPIGGSRIDRLSNITDPTPFNQQRNKLVRLKARKLRTLGGYSGDAEAEKG